VPPAGFEDHLELKCPRLLYQPQCESSVDFRFQRG
jgi:phage FluMu protein Com